MTRWPVRAKCSCGALLHAVTCGETLAVEARRTCRRCGRRWKVAVRPLRAVRGGFAHLADLESCARRAVTT